MPDVLDVCETALVSSSIEISAFKKLLFLCPAAAWYCEWAWDEWFRFIDKWQLSSDLFLSVEAPLAWETLSEELLSFSDAELRLFPSQTRLTLSSFIISSFAIISFSLASFNCSSKSCWAWGVIWVGVAGVE